MKLPITLAIILACAAAITIIWVTNQDFTLDTSTTIIVYVVTALGGLVSAVFVVYGYFVSLSVFKESQKPKLLLNIHNQRAILDSTNENVHQTIIRYANISQNECKGLTLKLTLIGGSESFDIPGLFTPIINIGINDDRCRSFPTFVYFRNNGIPESVIRDLTQYKLRASYSYTIMKEEISSYYDYVWNESRELWDVA
ncbi:hypothetical protein [Photobacterium kishitanii]|uniref:Uncharacterized protein n=1 Tax=Photobacterium kishitanii TaxID=318456 RepID=A0A2T3KJU8_9GAMM|nr:hypothetical protein [Photobacterium kishitanii]PSU86942.1 hypothetical protein C0W42_18410 [Photobacterium kishitanii]PSU99741.1 hypothetical protein C9J27_08895 [Photobacterium kishitanii]